MPTIYLPVFYLPVIGRSINWWFYYRALRGFFIRQSQITNHKSQITLLASWLYPDAVAAARLARDLGRPVWLRVHGTDRYHLKNRWRRRLILDAVASAQGVICNCQAVADDLAKSGIPAAKLHIVPNGVDLSLFKYRCKSDAWSELKVQPLCSSPLVLFVGNLVPIKGPDVMIKAFSLLVKALESTPHPSPLPQGARVQGSSVSPTLLLIGSGPMRKALERQARDLGIADQVHFLGSRPHQEVARWMNVADVLCLTSRSEGMPNVVSEALASGLPVVATDVGACSEMLGSEPAARLCNREDAAGLARAIVSISEAGADRVAMADRYKKQYSWQHQAGRLLQVLTDGSGVDP